MGAEILMNEAESHMLHTYNRYPVVLDPGEGVYLYDTEGRNIWILQPGSLCRRWDMETQNIIRR